MAAWMFKGNPKVFDIDAYLGSANPIWWTVGGPLKDPGQIAPGDRVFMFRAKSGVVAVGRALTGPTDFDAGAVLISSLWRKPLPEDGSTLMVQVELEEVRLTEAAGLLPVGAMERHPVLAGMPILKRSGTTYPVSADEERTLMDLWRSHVARVRPV